MLVEDFKKYMNAVEVNMEKFKNETIKDFRKQEKDGPHGPYVRLSMVTESGNWYANNMKIPKAEEIISNFAPGDHVLVMYKERPYTDKEGNDRIANDLVSLKAQDVDVNDDLNEVENGEENAEPLPTPSPDPKRGSAALSEPKKGYPDKDTSIIRQVSWKVAAEIAKSLELGENIEDNIEIIVSLAHTIEEDIQR